MRIVFGDVVELQNFDTGSSWIEVVYKSEEAYIFAASVIALTVNLYERWVAAQRSVQLNRAMGIDNDTAAMLAGKLDKATDIWLEHESQALLDPFAPKLQRDARNEASARVLNGAKAIADMYRANLKIVPALNAPAGLSAALPDPAKVERLAVGELTIPRLPEAPAPDAAPGSADEMIGEVVPSPDPSDKES
jgi:hypothetical protein